MTLLTLLLIATPANADLPWIATAKPVPEAGVVRYDQPAKPLPAAPGLFDQPATTPLPAASPTPTPIAATPAKPQAAVTANASTFAQRLTSLNLALSATVINEPNRWSFGQLQAEAQTLAGLASTEQQRAEVRALQGRLDQFASIATKLQQVQTEANADGWRRPSNTTAATGGRLAPPLRLTKSTPTSRHDAEGTLRPVVSKRANAPKYAVIDSDGKIAALVTPTADTEKQLKQMLGKRVGLTGQRGYLTDLRREHVVAERVTPLETVRR